MTQRLGEVLGRGYCEQVPTNTRINPMKELSPTTSREFGIDDLVCFCFGHTRRDIEKDYLAHGQSTILAHILADKKAGRCDCAIKNPRGR